MKHSAYKIYPVVILLATFFFLFTATGYLNAQEPTEPVIHRSSKSRGIPAYPYPVTVKQPDGTTLRIKAIGDRMLRLYETEDGYTVLQDKKGRYVHAVLDDAQQLVPSSQAVTPSKGAPDGIQPHLRYSSTQLDAAEKAYYADAQSKANPNPFPSTGNNNVLVILAEFADRAASRSATDIQNLLAAPDYNGTGSFRDYYLEVSYNNLTLEPMVTDWVQLSENMTYYGGNDAFGYDLRPDVLVREAVDSLEANGFDFSPFDNDGDGYVDEIILIHSGYGEQYTGSGDTAIWSHAFQMGDLAVSYDGVMMDNYIIAPELYGSSGTQLNSIGTVAHEFAHSLGIPDIYDVDLDGSGGYAFDLNFWDLMAVGSWNNNGITPAGINAWMKRYLDWMTIPRIVSAGTFTLNPASVSPDAYQLNTPVYNEYFIVENRQRMGFDSYLPGEGMLVYHVDLNYPGWLTGEINVDPTHQGFDIEEADHIRDTVTLGGDPFPGTANITSFDSTTTPSSRTWDGRNSDISLQNFTLAGDVITFEILDTAFSELPPDWQINELNYTQLGAVTGIPVIEGDTAVSGYLAAFVGADCRGIGSAIFHEATGSYIFDLKVFSNATSGEALEFRYYDPVQDSVYALYETLTFAVDSIAGDRDAPFIFHTPVHYVRNFNPGWNWFSMNVEMTDMAPGSIFAACTTDGDYIKSQIASSKYYEGFGWFGPLRQMNSDDLYILNVGASCGIDTYGVPALTPGRSRDLAAGWNWVSYTPQVAMSPTEALASLSPTQKDYVKSQVASATYYEGYGWLGTMKMMYPGDGYMLKLANSDVLVYPEPSSAKKGMGVLPEYSPAGNLTSSTGATNVMYAEGGAGRTSGNSGSIATLSFDPYKYEFNGSLTATVIAEGFPAGDEGDMLSVWAGDECRGIVHGMYFEPSGEVVFPLMVHSNAPSGETLSFRYYQASSGKTYTVNEQVGFERNMLLGDALDALVLTVDMVSGIDEPSLAFEPRLGAWPNPFSGSVTIDFILPVHQQTLLEVYDIYGNLVEVIAEGEYSSGAHEINWQPRENTPGTWFLKLSTGGCQLYKRIIYVE